MNKETLHRFKINRLQGWFVEHGGRIHKSLKIIHDDTAGYHLRLHAGQELSDVSPNDLVFCPLRLSVSVANVKGTGSNWLESFLTRFHDAPEVITRFLLIEQYRLGEDSFWWPYLDMLPKPADHQHSEPPFDTPLWFGEDDCIWLGGTNLSAARRLREEAWKREFEEGMALLSAGSKLRVSLDRVDWALYKWAATVLTSRCFPSSLLTPLKKNQCSTSAASGDDLISCSKASKGISKYPILFPVLDLANHDPMARVIWNVDSEGFTLTSLEGCRSGQQVYNNYGPKGNEELMMGYGFSFFKNPSDAFGLAISTSQSPQVADTHVTLSEDKESIPDLRQSRTIETFHLKADDFSSTPSLPPTLFERLRLMAANRREPSARRVDKHDSHFLTRIRAQISSRLLLALNHQRDKIRAFDPKLPPWPQNSRQFYASRYRRTQLRILEHHVKYLNHYLSSLCSSPYVLNLNDILTNSPSCMALPFRTAIHHSLRTRKADKLKENGYQDLVFTIWICTAWLTLNPITEKPEHTFHSDLDSKPTNIEEGYMLSHIQQWLILLTKHYRIPAGWDTSPHHNSTKRVSTDATPDSQLPPPSGEEHDWETYEVARSYHPVIQAAAERDPDSIYASKQWTTEFLVWGLETWREEAVSMPKLWSSEEPGEDGELVLFLEIED